MNSGLTQVKGLLKSKTALVGLGMFLVGLFGFLGLFTATFTATIVNAILLVGGALVIYFRAGAKAKIIGFLT